MAEAMALCFSVQVVIRLGYQHLIFESDNKSNIDALRTKNLTWSVIFNVLFDIKSLVDNLMDFLWSFEEGGQLCCPPLS